MPATGCSLVAGEDAVVESAGLLVCGATCFEVCSDVGLCCGVTLGEDPDPAVAVALAEPLDVAADLAEDVALALCFGGAVVHLTVGAVLLVAAGALLAELLAPPDAELLELGLDDGVPLGLGLTDGVLLALGLTDGVSLALGLTELLLPPGATAGLVVTAVVAWLDLVDAFAPAGLLADELGQVVGLVLLKLGMLADTDAFVPCVPLPSRAGGLAGEDDVPEMAELRSEPKCPIPLRVVGTTARTIPTTNTAMPAAKAGLSMASRQSRGRLVPSCPAGRPCAPVPLAGHSRRNRSATEPADRDAKPETASQQAMTPMRCPAWVPRVRIFSRMRSRPSAPGSIWSAAACSSRRRNSPKSCPCLPSKRPGLTMSPVLAVRAARPCRVPYGS